MNRIILVISIFLIVLAYGKSTIDGVINNMQQSQVELDKKVSSMRGY